MEVRAPKVSIVPKGRARSLRADYSRLDAQVARILKRKDSALSLDVPDGEDPDLFRMRVSQHLRRSERFKKHKFRTSFNKTHSQLFVVAL